MSPRGPTPRSSDTERRRVAIIGAGPTGRAAARTLAEAGAAVTVFEKEAEGGGLMRYGFPDFRMATSVPRRDTEALQELGVTFRFETILGKDVTLDELEKDFDAVLIATGAPQPRKLDVPGEGSPGVHHSLDYLHASKTGTPIDAGKTVIVIGGGDTAMDAAVTAVKSDATDVTLAYREPEPIALPHEVERAQKAKVRFRGDRQPARIDTGKPGLTVSFQDDSSMEGDTVILAIGQEVDYGFLKKLGLAVNEDGSTNHPKVFVAGGTRYGSDRLAKAIQDGRRAAERILRFS